jgi:sugar/nucleoside kinase (ribokinase family)
LRNVIYSLFIFLSLIFPAEAKIQKDIDIVGLGKAYVDIIAFVSEESLKQSGFKKGQTTMISDVVGDQIFLKMNYPTIISGGSVANVVVNVVSLGGRGEFNAISANDELGRKFRDEILEQGVIFTSPYLSGFNEKTARCFTFISPDKERTFAVADNITNKINDSFLNYYNIARAKIFYTDASNLDNGGSQSKVTYKAIDYAREHKSLVAFNLSDSYYIATYRNDILKILPNVDILFANEDEATSLFPNDTLDKTLAECLKYIKTIIITRGSKGAIIATGDEIINIPALLNSSNIVDLK